MEFFNSLNLTQIKGGTKLKQGDLGSVLSYSLTDENGQEITSFDNKTAYINLVLDDKIWFTTTTLVDISRVTFRIDKAIPIGLYYLEIKIDDYIFPSDRDSIILIEEGSTPYDLKELVPNYDINMTLKGILSDLSQKGIDIRDLENKTTAQLAEKADKDEVTNVMTPKGNIAYASLPMTGNSVGWYYYCPDGDGTHGAGNYVWNGTSWYFGGTGDEGYNLLKKGIGDLNESVFTVKGKEDLSWKIGAVNKADGLSVPHTKRIRSLIFQADGGIVDINGDYQIAVAVYSGNNLNTFEKYIDFSTSEYRFEKGKYYVIVIKADPEVDFSDSDINDVLTHVSIRFWNGDTKIESVEKEKDDLLKSVKLIKTVGLNSDIVFSVGGLNPADGSITDNTKRLHSDVIFAKKGSSIRIKPYSELKFAVYKYSDQFGNGFISANALSLDDYEFTEDTYARILIESGNQNDLEKFTFDIFQTDIKELNDFVKYAEVTDWVDKGFIKIEPVGEYTKFVISHTAEWSFMVLPVHNGDKFIIHGYGGNGARLYAFTDKFGKVLEKTEKTNTTEKLVITAPSDGYAIFNALRSEKHYVVKYTDNHEKTVKNRNLIVPPYMPDMNKTITSVPNNKTTVMTYEEIMTAWENLRQKYPNYITRTLLGKDTSGTLDMYRYDFKPEIVSLEASVQDGINKIYTKDDYPIVIMGACIHGAERPCAKALLNLMELIADAKDYSILGWLRNNIHFVIIPLENPWGYKNDKRTNVNQVDLNRNFEPFWEKGESTTENERYRGTAPLSEKETQYIDSILKECADKAVCYYSFHTHGVFTSYSMMTNFSSPALFLLNDMQNIGMSVTKMITTSGWTNHNLPEDSGYIGCMEMAYGVAMASYQGAKYNIPSACPEVMYRYYDGGTSEVYNTDLDCMNAEYMLYAVANACAKFLYSN